MRTVFEDHLFAKGRLVAASTPTTEVAVSALATLHHLFGIHLTAHAELADASMVEVAARCLGRQVPEPFYRGFPESVRELEPVTLVLDQLIHYARTYGLGDFTADAGHSLFERALERVPLKDHVTPRTFEIVDEREALSLVAADVDALLKGSRPLSEADYALVLAYVQDFGLTCASVPNKDTVCRLILDTRDASLSRLITLADALRLVEWMAHLTYRQHDIKHLNLQNRDRKLLVAVLDRLLAADDVELECCLERRRLWKGLMHHLHYQPKGAVGETFTHLIFSGDLRSELSTFELLMKVERPVDAARWLRAHKGEGALLRALARLVAACSTTEEVERVLEEATSTNKVILIQLLQRFSDTGDPAPRTFHFWRLGRMVTHHETEEEAAARRSLVSPEHAALVRASVQQMLQRACHGTLGTVYVDERMRKIALPLRQGASLGGVGTLPSGSRVALESDKVVRVFCYWELVDDIDLSAIALDEDAQDVLEFSWRTNGEWDRSAICHSGDETAGFKGGSEYFDVDVARFRAIYPNAATLVFIANVYTSGATFDACVCRAGHMLREQVASGEVYEPSTVATAVNVSAASTFCFLLALDLQTSELIHLNIAEAQRSHVAGTVRHDALAPYLHATETINLYDFARMLASEVTDDPAQAEVAFTDSESLELAAGCERISSRDTERIRELLG